MRCGPLADLVCGGYQRGLCWQLVFLRWGLCRMGGCLRSLLLYRPPSSSPQPLSIKTIMSTFAGIGFISAVGLICGSIVAAWPNGTCSAVENLPHSSRSTGSKAALPLALMFVILAGAPAERIERRNFWHGPRFLVLLP